jgi:hypothetical protein
MGTAAAARPRCPEEAWEDCRSAAHLAHWANGVEDVDDTGGLSGLDEMERDIVNVRFLTEKGPEVRGLERQGSASPCEVVTELSVLNDVMRYV